MSVTIRLAKIGKKFAPTYKVVVATTRDKRNGRYIEVLGSFNPSIQQVNTKNDSKVDSNLSFKIDKTAYDKWVSNGAMVTKAVTDLIGGTYVFKPYNPKKAAAQAAKEAELAKAAAEA